MKVFLSIYIEFIDLTLEKVKEEDYRRLFTLIDSSRKSLLHPEFMATEYREYSIIRIENFFKSEIPLNGLQAFKSRLLKQFYLKFQFIMFKISRVLEIKYILDEDFKDLIKKPNYSFLQKKIKALDSMEISPIHINTKTNLFEDQETDRKLLDFLALKVNYWQEMGAENTLVNQKQPNLTCKICLKPFPVVDLQRHSYRCKEQAELNKDLIDLKKEFNKAEIFSKELVRKLFLENQLER